MKHKTKFGKQKIMLYICNNKKKKIMKEALIESILIMQNYLITESAQYTSYSLSKMGREELINIHKYYSFALYDIL